MEKMAPYKLFTNHYKDPFWGLPVNPSAAKFEETDSWIYIHHFENILIHPNGRALPSATSSLIWLGKVAVVILLLEELILTMQH